MQYSAEDDVIFDMVVRNVYGDDAVKNGAVEYVLDLNQNFARENGTHIDAGTIINLPDTLPSRFFEKKGLISVFVD